ncbi:MAG: SIMPL domain-containing protein [Bacteroidota bacterium]|jgi:uncharacterized protein YggE
MYRYFIATVLIILINTTSRAQITSTKSDNQPYIEVNGTAEKEVVPDEIFISITLREKYVDKTKITIDIQEESLINALKNIGIDLSNLYLSDANADYVKVYWQKKDVLTRKDYTLKVSNATAVGNVFIELDKIKITDAYVSKVNHSKIDSLKKDVKIKAIQSAKDKADYLLQAIGEKTGKPIIVKENEVPKMLNGSSVRNLNSVTIISERDKLEDKLDTDIQFNKILVTSNIYVKFLIQ